MAQAKTPCRFRRRRAGVRGRSITPRGGCGRRSRGARARRPTSPIRCAPGRQKSQAALAERVAVRWAARGARSSHRRVPQYGETAPAAFRGQRHRWVSGTLGRCSSSARSEDLIAAESGTEPIDQVSPADRAAVWIGTRLRCSAQSSSWSAVTASANTGAISVVCRRCSRASDRNRSARHRATTLTVMDVRL